MQFYKYFNQEERLKLVLMAFIANGKRLKFARVEKALRLAPGQRGVLLAFTNNGLLSTRRLLRAMRLEDEMRQKEGGTKHV